MIECGTKDIVMVSWILRCVQERCLHQPFLHDYLFMTIATSENLMRVFDTYGDSYTEDLDSVRLKDIIDHMPLPDCSLHWTRYLSAEERDTLDDYYMLFAGFVVYMDMYDDVMEDSYGEASVSLDCSGMLATAWKAAKHGKSYCSLSSDLCP
jgi:hypothetical protein